MFDEVLGPALSGEIPKYIFRNYDSVVQIDNIDFHWACRSAENVDYLYGVYGQMDVTVRQFPGKHTKDFKFYGLARDLGDRRVEFRTMRGAFSHELEPYNEITRLLREIGIILTKETAYTL